MRKKEADMASRVLPIKPSEVVKQKKESFPDEVFEAFNELIAEKFSGYCAEFKQEAVVARMVAKGLSRAEIFSKGWLDVEDVYRAQGWDVEYDSPGYNESYPATFKFTPQKKR